IEAAQPEPVRGDWAAHRANTWHKLARPGRFVHYIELRKLLIEHGDRLANDIDNSSASRGHATPRDRWRLRADPPGVLVKFPAVVGGNAQVFLAVPYTVLTGLGRSGPS
ncbi:MAG TPA: hypothetical protein VKB69_04230, partial [Micromonosporaceae bacterium]|nr:hypothetical protein [Micromonosporaceae bacterium]